uniref:Dirigent protein n=1 Tax=Davallia tyermanii TaxID=328207 RepID=A0A1C9V3S2_9MONI|nr:hypothetical protein [Davallia tyermanii]
MAKVHIMLLCTLCALSLSSLSAPQPALAASGPDHLDFYMYIAVQNNSNLDNPNVTFTAVQSAQPLSTQPNSFGIIHTFDNPLTSAADLNSTQLGHVQGWYGDVGQNLLTLFLAQTFTWNDGTYNGTFSLLGVDVASDAVKFAPIVGGTGDFAYVRGVAQQSLVSTATVNMETVSWFFYAIDFVY